MKPRTSERPVAERPAAGASPLLNLARAWDRFWFTPADPTVLGLMRICGGLLVLYIHVCYTFDLLSYVGHDRAWVDSKEVKYLRDEMPVWTYPNYWPDPAGFTQAELTGKGQYNWSIFFHVEDPRWIYAIHFALLGVMLLFTLGLWTRVTAVLTWMAVLCYVHRAMTSLFGMDQMMVLLLFYLMLGPSGACLSLDRLLLVRREKLRHGPGHVVPPPEPSVAANFVVRLIQVHFCIIYMASGTSKLLGARWWNGTSLWYCYANNSFAPVTVKVYWQTLIFLCQHRWLWELVMTGGAVFTLFMEIGLPFLIWLPRWRWLMVAGAVLLHTGIGMFMGLVTFSLFMLVLLLSFIPPEAIKQLVAEMEQQGKWLLRLGRGKGAEGRKAEGLVPARS